MTHHNQIKELTIFLSLSLRWRRGTQVERLHGRPNLTKKAVPAERLAKLTLLDPKRAKRREEMIRSGKGEMRERGRGEKIVNSWCSKREPREIRTSVWRESVAEILNSGRDKNE
jgi:hypothetical protein